MMDDGKQLGTREAQRLGPTQAPMSCAGEPLSAFSFQRPVAYLVNFNHQVSMSDPDGPPWIAYNPDGSIHMGGVPERLLHHPEMQRRGIKLVAALNPVRLCESAPNLY